MTTESYVQVAADSSGKKVDTVTVTLDDATQQYRQTVTIGDANVGGAVAYVTREGKLIVDDPDGEFLLSQILIELKVMNTVLAATLGSRDDLDQLRASFGG